MIILIFLSCSELEDFKNSDQAYYMPDIDLYVMRGTVGSNEFNLQGGGPVYEFILKSFVGNAKDTLNHYLKTIGITFHHSRIRLFYIRSGSQVAETGGLGTLMGAGSFELTNEDATADKGTVYNDSSVLRIFFIGDTNPGAGYIGLATVGFGGILILSGGGYSSNLSLTNVVGHELGHNFSLTHPFNSGDGSPNSDNCDPAQLGSTNRLMDYVGITDYFAPCERIIAAYKLEGRYGSKTIYDPSRGPSIELYIGDWTGTITVGQPYMNMEISPNIQIEVD